MQTSTRYKALKDGEKFTVDLSLNRICPAQLPQLIALLDQLPGIALDLSINNFDWSDLKELLIQQFNPRGFRQVLPYIQLHKLDGPVLDLDTTSLWRLCRWIKEGRLTIAATPGMQQTEVYLAAVAESLANASKVLNTLSIKTKDNYNELQNLSFGLESEAKMAMQQYLSRQEGEDAVTEDNSLCHLYRDKAHILADASRKKPKEFSFDAAFVIDPSKTGNIWVGEIKTKLNGSDVTTAHKKKQELQDYIDRSTEDLSDEPEIFQRQAAQLRFLRGRSVKLFVGGARMTSEAEAEIDRLSCVRLIPNGARFDVVC